MQRAAAQSVLALGLVPNLAFILLHEGRLEGHRGVGQGRVHMLSLTGTLPVQQGQGHAVGAHEPGPIVVDRVGLHGRRSITAETPVHTRRRLGELLVAGPASPGPQVAEGIQRRVDDIRLPFADILVA